MIPQYVYSLRPRPGDVWLIPTATKMVKLKIKRIAWDIHSHKQWNGKSRNAGSPDFNPGLRLPRAYFYRCARFPHETSLRVKWIIRDGKLQVRSTRAWKRRIKAPFRCRPRWEAL